MNKQIKFGVILSYAQNILSIVIGLIYTPTVLRILGSSEYGLYNAVSSTIAMFAILTLGFNYSYLRFYSKYKNNEGNESVYKLNGLYFTVFLIMGIVAFLCGLYISNNLQIIFKDGLTNTEYILAKKLAIVLTINLSISFPMTIFENILFSHENFIVLKGGAVLRTIIGPLATIPVLLLGYGSFCMVIVTTIISFVLYIIYIIYVFYILKERFIFKNYEKGLLKEIFEFSFFIALTIIVDQINWNIDKVLLGRYKGTISVSIYTIGFALFAYYKQVATSISSIFAPKVHNIYNGNSKNKKHEISSLFLQVGRIQFFILALLASGVVLFGKSFIFYWVGPGYNESYYVSILLIIPASISLIQTISADILHAENKHKFQSLIYLGMAFFNFFVSIFLCKKWGPIGAAVGTAISLIIANGIIMNIFYNKQCDIDIPMFWKGIIKESAGLIIPLLSGIIILLNVHINSASILLLLIIIYTLIYLMSMWMCGLNKEEKQIIINILKRKY